MSTYKHTQSGTFSRTTFGVLIVLVVVVALYLGVGDPKAMWVFGLIGFLMMIGLLLFHSLTVEIRHGYLRIRFGIGVIRKTIPMKDIESAETVRNRWWYGWGIKLTPHGWLFSVSGFDAVQIKLKSGRQYRIGTDEPGRLLAAIETAKKFR
jgi:hypothetical protein